MNRFGKVMGGLAAAALLVVAGTQLPSCAAVEQVAEKHGDKIYKLTEIGLAIAESQGVVSQGDRLLIGTTAALLTTPGPKEDKLIALADIGLSEAVKEGVIKPGDSVLIKDAINVIVTPSKAPAETAAAVELLAEEQKPPSK